MSKQSAPELTHSPAAFPSEAPLSLPVPNKGREGRVGRPGLGMRLQGSAP